jgi:hypothetical protein
MSCTRTGVASAPTGEAVSVVEVDRDASLVDVGRAVVEDDADVPPPPQATRIAAGRARARRRSRRAFTPRP